MIEEVDSWTPRPAEARDLEAIGRLEERCFSTPWRAGALHDAFESASTCLRVIEDPEVRSADSPILAYVIFRLLDTEAELLRIGVSPELRQLGAGRRLLRCVVREARDRGARRIFLEVRPSSAAALALYRRAGFRVVGRRTRYYPDGEDAHSMALDLLSDGSPGPGATRSGAGRSGPR